MIANRKRHKERPYVAVTFPVARSGVG